MANISGNSDIQATTYCQGGFSCLVSLLKTGSDVCRRYAAMGMRLLSCNPDVRKMIVNESMIAPILGMASSGILDYQKSAAAALASMSLDGSSKFSLLKKGALKYIFCLLNHHDSAIRRHATFAAANMAGSCELHLDFVKEGGIQSLRDVQPNNDIRVIRDISRAFASLSVTENAKKLMVDSDVLSLLLVFARSRDLATQRYAALAICNSSVGERKVQIVEKGALKTLIFLLRFSDLEVGRCVALSIAALSLGKTENKVQVVKEGAIRPMIEMLKFPDQEVQRCVCLALNSVALGDHRTKRNIVNEGGLKPLLAILESGDEECVHSGIYIIGSLFESEEIRGSLIELGAIESVANRSKSGSIDTKRACGYFLSLLAQSPEYHDEMEKTGGLQCVIDLASLVDNECQEYGAFALAFLASNHDYQVSLVQKGAVRPLVSIMATDSEPKHYAGLALLKLADNFENHIIIAEEGGIQALLKLGRSRVTGEELQYKAALTVGHLASNAIRKIPRQRHSTDDEIGVAAAEWQGKGHVAKSGSDSNRDKVNMLQAG